MKLRSKLASCCLHQRTKLGWTQSQTAEIAGISVRWYQKIESGANLPGTALCLRLLHELKIDLHEFDDLWGD